MTIYSRTDSSQRTSAYMGQHVSQLVLLRNMWADDRVQCYDDAELPPKESLQNFESVFLAGPTSRHQLIEYNWRCEAVSHLRQSGFRGFIFVPEPRGGEREGDFTERGVIHQWEASRLLSSSQVLFWIPRDKNELLGLNTNLELGIFIGRVLFSKLPTNVFIGWPNNAERMGLPEYYATELAGLKRYETLEELCSVVAVGSDCSAG